MFPHKEKLFVCPECGAEVIEVEECHWKCTKCKWEMDELA